MSVFAKVNEARATEGGRYFEPGNYVVLINRIKHGETRKGVDFFVVETKVLESDCAAIPAGSECSWMVTLDKDAALGNIKSFAMAATGCADNEVDEAGILELVSDRQPLAGQVMRVEAFNKPTRDGKPFTRVKWLAPTDVEAARYTKLAQEKGYLDAPEKGKKK